MNQARATRAIYGFLVAMNPSAYLFDIGNVILRFDFQIAVRRILDRCTADAEMIMPLMTPSADAFERGKLTVDEFAEVAIDLIGFSGSQEEFSRAFAEIFSLNQPVADLIEKLASADEPLFLFSNTNEIHKRYFTREWDSVFGRFAGAIYSHEVGHMKPENRIYEIAIETLDLDPGRTFYIDDREENIVAGAALGFQAFQYDFNDHEALELALRN